jgi:antitoxin (DNA-binding transcriptional repressor) of toxin-antitoxin stability system
MQAISLSLTEVVRGFSEYVNRVAYRGERFILLKGRKPIAELRPIPTGLRLGELEALLRSLPALSPAEAESLAGDMDAARTELQQETLRDPWQS